MMLIQKKWLPLNNELEEGKPNSIVAFFILHGRENSACQVCTL